MAEETGSPIPLAERNSKCSICGKSILKGTPYVRWVVAHPECKALRDTMLTTTDAAAKVGIPGSIFSRLARRLNLAPDATFEGRHNSGKLWLPAKIEEIRQEHYREQAAKPKPRAIDVLAATFVVNRAAKRQRDI